MFSKMMGKPISEVTAGVLLSTQKSLTDIANQTYQRMLDSGLVEVAASDVDSTPVLTLDHPEFGKVIIETVMMASNACRVVNNIPSGALVTKYKRLVDAGCNCFLNLLDETQIGIQEGQQFDKWMQESLGVDVINKPYYRFKPPTLFVGVTATAHQKLIWPYSNLPKVVIYAKPGQGYCGRGFFNKRIIDIADVQDEHDIVALLKKHCKNLKGQKGPYKHFIFRMGAARGRGLDEERMIRAAAELLDITNVQEFSSHKKNLSNAAKYISRALTDGHSFVILKMGLGAGVTIKNKSHIGCWWSRTYKDVEANAQCVGRNFGYNLKGDYPIFNNRAVWEEYDARMSEIENGVIIDTPEERNGKKKRSNSIIKWHFSPKSNNQPKYALARYSKYLACRVGGIKTFMSNNNENDLADIIVRKLNRANIFARAIVPGVPPNKKFMHSWRALCEQFPRLKEIDLVENAKSDDPLVLYASNIVGSEKIVRHSGSRGRHQNGVFTKNSN